MHLPALFLVAATLLLSSCDSAQKKTLARVNDAAITTEDFDAQLRVLKTVRPNQKFDQAVLDQLLDQMVKQELLVQEAEKRGYANNAELMSQIDAQRKALRTELENKIADAQAQLHQLDRAIRSKALIEHLLRDFAKGVKPDDKRIKAYYKEQSEKGHKLPPYDQVKGKIAEQLTLDQLVNEVQGDYTIVVDQEMLAGHVPGK